MSLIYPDSYREVQEWASRKKPLPRQYEIPLNNQFNFGYHLDISMDVLSEGVRAPTMEEVLVINLSLFVFVRYIL